MRRIELLAPAKDTEHGRIAIDYGADALYIGGARFGARYAATNTTDDIARLVEYARGYGVKVYATMNTVIFDNELDAAYQIAKELIDAGVSALIVQDMAFMRMKLQNAELHASTQTTNIDPRKIEFLSKAGFSRVILERGLSLAQIEEICRTTDCDIECFVHGAICVGNSGECYLSKSQGARSGNRGECSQPCRLSYDLTDANGNTVMGHKHLLSVKDMNLSPRLTELLDAGVTSLKIEGRLKDVNYIKNVVGHYRQTLDRIFERSRGKYCRSSEGRTVFDFTPDPERAFTRGGSLYFLDGKRAGVGSHDTPKAVGRELGTVGRIGTDWFTINGVKAAGQLSAGDGICVVCDGHSEGTNINKVEDGRLFPNKMNAIKAGATVYCNLDRRFNAVVERSRTKRVIDADAVVKLTLNSMTLTIVDSYGYTATETINREFDMASNPEKMIHTLKTQIAKSGETIFAVNNVEVEFDDKVPFIPITDINELRRSALNRLKEIRLESQFELNLKIEDRDAKYPSTHLGGEGNVTNKMARQFYTDHGVENFEMPYELANDLRGKTVMTTPYCIRREIGECLKENPKLKGDLYLTRGNQCFELRFDCAHCIMKLVKC